MIYASHLDQFVVAGAFVADDPVDIDDVAAVNPDKATIVQSRLDVADCERAKQLVVAVEDIGVVRVSVNRDDLFDGKKMGAAVPFDRQMTGKPPSGAYVPRPNSGLESASAAADIADGVAAISGTVRGMDSPPGTATDCGAARAESGRRSKRNIPEIQNATTATTMARMSVDSAGAPDDAVTKG